MLSRREIRACSVDLGRDQIGTTAVGTVAQTPTELSPTMQASPKSLLQMIQAPPSNHSAFLAPKRKVKPVQDAETLVREAIMKLEMQGPVDD